MRSVCRPSPEGSKVAVCWYDRSYIQLMDHQKDDTLKTRLKTR